MKIQKVFQWFGLLIIMLVATRCAQSIKSMETPSPEVPTNDVSPIKTVAPTSTSTSTSTPTTVLTLPAEDAREMLLELLATNGDCRLPCLWDITPGKSSNQEARNILMPLSSISTAETTYFEPTPLRGVLGGTITPLYVEGDLRLNARVAYLYGNDGVISLITFRLLEEQVTTDSNGNWVSKRPIFDSTTFAERVEYYSLPHLLNEQGMPDLVMVASSGLSVNLDRSIPIHIAVLYPDKGIWALYTTSINEDEVGDIIKACPENMHIEMNLFQPGDPDAFYALLEKTDWGITKNSYKPLEEATSISVEEFYETFRNPTDKCIETPIEIWPTPES